MKQKLPIPKFIFVLVIGAHAGLCFFLFTKTYSKPRKSPGVIKTRLVKVQSPPKKVPTQSKATQKRVKTVQRTQLAKSPPPKVKKVTPKKRVSKKTTQVTKPKLPEKKVIAAAPPKSTLTVPKNLGDLAVEKKVAKSTELNPSPPLVQSSHEYQKQLSSFLRAHLKLPRNGRITLNVLVKSDGTIQSVEVLEASDREILHTIKDKIAKITLPPFSHELVGQKEQRYTFEFY